MSQTAYRLRPACAADADGVAAIWNPIITSTTITFTTTLKAPQALAEEMGKTPYVVAEGPDGLAGFACLTTFRNGPGYARVAEHSLHLAPQARGQGLGARLLRALEERAIAADLHILVAGISGENPGAVRFHRRQGFEQVGLMPGIGYKFGRALDLVLMQKKLSPQP